MRVSLKLFVPVLLAVIAVSLLFSGYQVRRDRRIQERDLSRRDGAAGRQPRMRA